MKKYTYPLLAISGGLLLTGCGGDDSSSNTESATFLLVSQMHLWMTPTKWS
ncbi:hypothetical protein ACIL2W_001339 [Vibrio parahaemolyticus]